MSKPVTGRTRDLVILLDKMIYFLTKHWLAAVNIMVAIYVALPLMAPWLMYNGHERVAGWIYRLYGPPVCNQLATHSYFVYGPQYIYSAGDLQQLVGSVVPPRYIGDANIGFKLGICERCLSIYLTTLFAGLAFGLVRGRLRPIPWKYLAILMAPMVIDGTGQLIGLWLSTWVIRSITGILASAGIVLFVYPFVEVGMDDARRTIVRQLHLDQGSDSGAFGGKDEDQGAKSAQDHQGEELVQPR